MTWRDLFDMVGGMRSQEGRRRASVLWVCCSAAPRRGPNPKVIVMARKPDFFSYNMSSVQGDPGASGYLTLTVESGLPVAPVPLPAAAWLLLSGLGGLSWFGRSKRKV